MDIFSSLLISAGELFTYKGVLYLLVGTSLGLIFGAVPGLSAVAGMVLVLPFTYGMDPHPAMLIYAGIISVTALGGSLPAVTLNIPGTPMNIVTGLDGYPMVRRGEAGRALAVCSVSCFVGCVLGLVVLLSLLPVVQLVIFKFRAPEIFWVVVVGLAVLLGVSREDPVKGVTSACLGFLAASVGWNDLFTVTRFTGGSIYLWNGIGIIPFFLGLLAISEVIQMGSGQLGATVTPLDTRNIHWGRQIRQGIRDVLIRPKIVLRSAAIGALVGIVPGAGGAVASVASYASAKRLSPDNGSYGTGNVEGLIAAEVALDAKEGGALLPTVAFGVPGSPDLAIFLGALVMHGLQPGPQLLTNHMDVVTMLILGIVASQVVGSVVVLLAVREIARLTRLPVVILVPIVITFCLAGTYSIQSNVLDLVVLLLAGFLGIILKKYEFPLLPIALTYVLTNVFEVSFNQTLMMGLGHYTFFFSSWISIVLVCGLLFLLANGLLKQLRVWRFMPSKKVAQYEADGGELPTIGEKRATSLTGGELLFYAVLFILAGSVVFVSLKFFNKAYLLPLATAFVMLWSLVLLCVRALRIKSIDVTQDDATRDDVRKRNETFISSLWVTAFPVAVILVGFYLATISLSFAFLRVKAKASWLTTFAITGFLAGVLFWGFEGLLHVDLWPGLVPEVVEGYLGGGLLPPL
jgi:putative tricarboxylic transport membrane protein